MSDLRIERVVVTGGRGFTDRERIEADLRALKSVGLRHVAQGGNGLEQFEGNPPATIVSADAIAWQVANDIELEVTSYRVNRKPGFCGERTNVDGLDRRAPLRRNIRMLEAERPDLVLAYPDARSRGTWHCVAEALKRGIPVAVWAPWCAPRPQSVDTNGPLPCSWLAADEEGRVIFGPKNARGVLILRALEVLGA